MRPVTRELVSFIVLAVLVTAIHVFLEGRKSWVAGTRPLAQLGTGPAMTIGEVLGDMDGPLART